MTAKITESSQEVISSALLKYIDDTKHDTACWYAVNSSSSSPHSLCKILGIEKEWYPTFLYVMGFTKKNKNGEQRTDWNKMEAFGLKHLGTNGWDRHRPAGVSSPFIWFRIGRKNLSDAGHSSVKLQLSNPDYSSPPINHRARSKFLRKWNANKPNKKIDENKSSSPNKLPAKAEKKTNIPSIVTPLVPPVKKIPTVRDVDKERILNVLGRELLSKLFEKEALQDVVRVYKSSLTVEDVLDALAITNNQVIEEQERILQLKRDAVAHATRPKTFTVNVHRFPFLMSKRIKVNNSDQIARLLREVSSLQKEVVRKNGTDIFEFLQANDKSTTLIRVPTSTTRKHFERNLTCNNKGYNFVNRMLDGMVPTSSQVVNNSGDIDENDEDDAVDHSRSTVKWTKQSHAAEGMMVYLGKKFGAAFVRAADALSMQVVKKNRMDAITSAAMCDDAGLSTTQKRIINNYTTYHLGHPLTAPDSKVRALGDNFIPPISGECEVNNERCPFWKKDPVEVFEKKITEAVEPNPNLDWDHLDIIMGGDHGQGAFCLPVKLLLKKKEEIKIKFEYNLGEVVCKKDTSDILRASIMPYINERLKTIIKYERDETNKIKNDGTIYEFRNIESGVSRFSFNGDAKDGEDLLRKRDLRFIVTGDLAFYSVILGMKNASSFHCHLCLLRKTDWEKRPLEKGDARSMQWILSNWPKATTAKGGRVCGVIEKPLLDAIDPSRFVVPPLHSMLGIANSILNDFKVFIDLLLEDAPPKLKAFRNSELMAEKALNNKSQEIAEWGTLNGPALAECHEEKEELLTLQQSMLVAGEGTDEERTAIVEELSEIHERLASLNNEREALVAEEVVLSTEWKRKKARLSAFLKKKDSKKYTKPVRAQFEACLRKFGIDYAAYHGGDLVGNDCRTLMKRAEEIFAQLEVLLLALARDKRKSIATREAISSRCAAIRDALVVFDSVFAIVNKRNADVVMERDLPRLEMLLRKAVVAWTNLKDKNDKGNKNITPKVHGLVQHLPEQFKMYGGMGDFDEQFVERHHQTGKKDRYRSRNMRDPKRKYTCHSRWEEIRKNRKVMAISENIKQSRKRNFKGDRKPSKKEEAWQLRQENRERIVSNIIPRDLSGESARILSIMELAEYNPVDDDDIDYDRVNDGEEGGAMMDGLEEDDVIGAENI